MANPQAHTGIRYTRPSVTVYTDGACQNNGLTNPRAGIGGVFVECPHLNFSLRCPGRQSSNSAEIHAANHAVYLAKKAGYGNITIWTDSEFVINCMHWKGNWKVNGWRKANGELVENREELQLLDQSVQGVHVSFEYVPGHSGNRYNELADCLARDGCSR
ncbi:unnamed protein product [Allacma fusca]|uniref:ribonuclease H n=1 Tax=Allacma fusca TaxID=39272 RepID=A0A8J2Q741_9HEXA|nr:unnamed protein product [Allacma fusca]